MKSPIRTLIIDDERLARRDLVTLLRDFREIDVVGEADDVPSAALAVACLDPDLIFLDIQMPGQSGFDLLEKIETRARVIFVTAYDAYALRAFEVNALDYLLKPVNPARLARALEKLKTQESESTVRTRPLEYDDRLFVMFGNRFRFLKVSSMLSIHAAGDYSEIRLLDGTKGLTLKSMKEWEHRLPPQYFIRIHRSAIINMEYVESVEESFNYSLRVFMKGVSDPLLVSRRYAVRLKERLS
jgi:two-component system, LytTR family, response regulator